MGDPVMRNTITVSEIFGPTIAGEGPIAGLPTIFVRTGGCDYRCAWCDTMYAVDPKHKDEWEEMSHDEILDRILNLSLGHPLLVSLSGGNPAMQPLGELIAAGQEMHYTFALETQGTVAAEWFRQLDHLVLSPKPPSSGMTFHAAKLARCLQFAAGCQSISLKLVIFDEADFNFARHVSRLHPDLPVYLQAGTSRVEAAGADAVFELRDSVLERMDWLAARAVGDKWFEARVSCQQHVLLWGDQRGV
jgi:7-carboxy-7-deazaguanine synthase